MSPACDSSVDPERTTIESLMPTVGTMRSPVRATRPHTRPRAFGMPVLALIGLAMLGLPRVILHDLHIIDSAHPLSWILSLGPVAVWVVVTVTRNVPRPFLTVLTIGVIFGVMLAVTHQLLWDNLYAEHPEFRVQDGIAGIVPRLTVVPGGLFAGAALGALGGLVALATQVALGRNRKRH